VSTPGREVDQSAFAELAEEFRAELQLHCYRILGSVQDAEDLVQETLLAAWRGHERFEGRSALRTWLYRIATNRSLNALRERGRRPRDSRRRRKEPPRRHRRLASASPSGSSPIQTSCSKASSPSSATTRC
jgi:RNA polymerase sigma-70 factor (ECF subfamily)